MNCLDIPIPGCVQELLREPPVCFQRAEDAHALDRIRKFGAELGRPDAEIDQACRLASGPSDLVVMLERPAAGQEYDVSFDRFFRDCETLRAVDKLIRFSSKGARSIHTVSVLDAFSFSPTADTAKMAGCHRLLEDILSLKKPRVAICCWKVEQCHNPVVSQFMSRGVGWWPLCERGVLVNTWHTTLVRSFHPSAVINYRTRSPYSRMLLICHFVLAFAGLGDHVGVPPWMEAVCREASRERNDRPQEYIERTVIHLLRMATAYQPNDNGGEEERKDVDYLLRRLFSSGYSRGAANIAHLCLAWKSYSHPKKDDILAQLHDFGSQQVWFLPEDGQPDPRPPLTLLFPGFDDDNDGGIQQLESLSLNNGSATPTGAGQTDIDEGVALLERLQERFLGHKTYLEELEQAAAELSAQVREHIDLPINASSRDRSKLSSRIAGLLRDRYGHLAEAASLVHATPAILAGDAGLTREEEPPEMFLIRRHDGQSIADQTIEGVEPLANTGFRCSLLLAGLAGQGKLLLPRRKERTDGSEALLELPAVDLEGLIERFRYGLGALKVLRNQYGGDGIPTGFSYKELQPFEDGAKSEGGVYDIRLHMLRPRRPGAPPEQPDEVDVSN